MTSEDFITSDEYAHVMGALTEIWMKNNGKKNSDVLMAIADMDISIREKIYMAFIHGIEVQRDINSEMPKEQTEGDGTGNSE